MFIGSLKKKIPPELTPFLIPDLTPELTPEITPNYPGMLISIHNQHTQFTAFTDNFITA